MMLFSRLLKLYESRGFQVRSSITPHMTRTCSLDPDDDMSSTYIFRDGKHASPMGGGIHLTEVLLLELLGRRLPRRNIAVVGNSFGWSTFALALSNPQARVVALDACQELLTSEGLELTNRIAREEGLNIEAVRGRSPTDVERAVARLEGPPDLYFIDAWHDDAHQTADFEAARGVASPDCVYLFHDVVACRMLTSFFSLTDGDERLVARLLTRTQSGMGIIYPRSRGDELSELLDMFADPAVRPAVAERNGKWSTVLVAGLPSRIKGEIVAPAEYFSSGQRLP